MNKSKFLRRATALTLLIPGVIVIATLLCTLKFNPSDLYDSQYCVLQGLSFRYGVLVPVGAVLSFNMVVLVWSAIAITRQSKVQQSGGLNNWQKWKITLGT